MNGEDRELGMDRSISRRDFVHGATAATGAAAISLGGIPAVAQTASDAMTEANYPPLRHGMRGDHDGSMAAAHAERDGKPVAADPEDTRESYDLVVVGAGLSGIAAAYFYRQRAGAAARILILDNHDDFGGHARRNEYRYQGQTFLTPGGSDYMGATATWTYECKQLVKELGIDFSKKPPRSGVEGLGPSTFFSKETYGTDRLVLGGTPQRPTAEFLARTPLDKPVQDQLLRLMTDAKIDYLPGLSTEEKITKLLSMSYRDYLLNVVKVSPETAYFANDVWCMGADAITAWFAYHRYMPGFAGLGVPRPAGSLESPELRAQIYQTPAGNSDIARLMVRALIPQSLPPGDWMAIETVRVDYSTLDQPSNATRLRLLSTVVRAKHTGATLHQFDYDTREVEVTYIKDGKSYLVHAKDVVMAGMNNMIPYICPELPDDQKAALHQAVRAVNQQTNILVRNWEAFARLKTTNIAYPHAFYDAIRVGSGAFDAKGPVDPSQPVLVMLGGATVLGHDAMTKEILGGKTLPPGTPLRDQFRAVRVGLLRTPFSTFERAVRSQMARALAGADFDPARDIIGITLNRWGHGYAVGRDHLFNDEKAPAPFLAARKKFGHIAIANSDASGLDHIQTAMDEAFRAVRELEPRHYGSFESI